MLGRLGSFLAAAALGAALVASPLVAVAHGISDADKQRMLEGGYLQYVGLGATHMLTGYDHLLFLFGVVFFLTTFKDIAKFVTAFTLGHCITLIVATFLQITWNYFLVDALIAVSVIYKGFDNNGGFQKHFGVRSPNLLAVVFGFGLLHGFGLSTRLQQLPLGDDEGAILMRILSFNVGVEIGQIAALSMMVVLLALWRQRSSFQRFSVLANVALVYAGVLLLLMQLHGYQHDTDPNGFRFPAQEHRHEHEDMDIDKSTNTGRDGSDRSLPTPIHLPTHKFHKEFDMKKVLTALFAAAGMVAVLPAFAGEAADCHFHGNTEASQETVSGCAVKRQRALIASGKIDKSWQAIKPAALEQVDGQKGKEWKVTFKDPAAADRTKENLYMFFTAQGNFIAANFTGK